MKILPYYKLKKTEEDKKFFFNHEGYFNFWDEYLIMNTKEGHNKIFVVLVNRPNKKFSNIKRITEDYKIVSYTHIINSVVSQKPKDMFIDFPELRKFDFLREK